MILNFKAVKWGPWQFV